MFTFSKDSREIIETLETAAARGVDVTGVVDGDQIGQSFDAVPGLRTAEVDARYVPGVLTGGRGRMHHKLVVIDGRAIAMGTYNFTMSAQSNYEVMVMLRGPSTVEPASAAEKEIEAVWSHALSDLPRVDS